MFESIPVCLHVDVTDTGLITPQDYNILFLSQIQYKKCMNTKNLNNKVRCFGINAWWLSVTYFLLGLLVPQCSTDNRWCRWVLARPNVQEWLQLRFFSRNNGMQHTLHTLDLQVRDSVSRFGLVTEFGKKWHHYRLTGRGVVAYCIVCTFLLHCCIMLFYFENVRAFSKMSQTVQTFERANPSHAFL